MTVGSKTATYAYDADGIRTKMVAGDVTYEFVTQDGKLMRETATNSSAVYVMDFIYDNAGRPFAVKFSKNGGSSFTTFYYVLNLQGDVVAITKADGTVVAKYTYDAWGNLTSLINANGTEIVNRTTGTAIAFWNPLTYRGYIRDRETGFYYLQSRYYDPANHRFINADNYASTGQGFVGTNMFAYCNNNPVNYCDESGSYSTYCTLMTDSGGSISEDEKNQNLYNMMRFFGVNSAEEIPELADGTMAYVETFHSISYGFLSIVSGRTIVMDKDKYCEYTYQGISFGLSAIYIGDGGSTGYVYGVNTPGDYAGAFFGGSANYVVDAEGGAFAVNGVTAEVISGYSYFGASAGFSFTYYETPAQNWTYGLAPIEWIPGWFSGIFPPNYSHAGDLML